MSEHSTQPEDGTKRVSATRCGADATGPNAETLVVEAPLHIRLNGVAYTTTMRTPGVDRALARGLLFTEGIIPAEDAEFSYRETADPESGLTSLLDVTCAEELVAQSVEGRRTVMASASCGVCGTRDLADISVYGPPLRRNIAPPIDLPNIDAMRAAMQLRQPIFRASGGCHAAAIFDAEGSALAVCEDVGRHNAVDKAVGSLLEARRLADAAVLFVSGRVSYEIVYKAYRAGVPILLAVSAASSLAVETADRLGVTVAGFCRAGRATVYSHAERIRSRAGAER